MDAAQFPQAVSVCQKDFSIDELGLRDGAGQGSLEYITRVAQRIFSAKMALVGILEENRERQLLLSGMGLPREFEEAGHVPLSKSFTQFVRRDARSLAVEDKDTHPLGASLQDRDMLPYQSYLGAPIFGPSGAALGALVVLDGVARKWSDEDVAILEDLAHCVTDAILLRAALLTSQQLQGVLERSLRLIRRNIALRDRIVAAFTAPEKTAEERLHALLEAGCQALGMRAAALTRVNGPRTALVAQYRQDGGSQHAFEGDNSRSLTALLLSGQEIVFFVDPDAAGLAGRQAFDGSEPRCFIGAPLMLDGVAYGTLEFIGDEMHGPEDIEMEAGLVSVIAMFAITQLEVFSEIDRLKRSEADLLQYILELRAGQ